jgi:hypothetical protein
LFYTHESEIIFLLHRQFAFRRKATGTRLAHLENSVYGVLLGNAPTGKSLKHHEVVLDLNSGEKPARSLINYVMQVTPQRKIFL